MTIEAAKDFITRQVKAGKPFFVCCLIALDETADVGRSHGTPVSSDYTNPFAFTGTIDRVVVDLTGRRRRGKRRGEQGAG